MTHIAFVASTMYPFQYQSAKKEIGWYVTYKFRLCCWCDVILQSEWLYNKRNKAQQTSTNPSLYFTVLVSSFDKLIELVGHKWVPWYKSKFLVIFIAAQCRLYCPTLFSNLTDRLVELLNIRKDESIYRQVREAVGGIAPRCFYDRQRQTPFAFNRVRDSRSRNGLPLRWDDQPFHSCSRTIRREFITPSSTRLYRCYASKMKTFSAPLFWFFYPAELLREIIPADLQNCYILKSNCNSWW